MTPSFSKKAIQSAKAEDGGDSAASVEGTDPPRRDKSKKYRSSSEWNGDKDELNIIGVQDSKVILTTVEEEGTSKKEQISKHSNSHLFYGSRGFDSGNIKNGDEEDKDDAAPVWEWDPFNWKQYRPKDSMRGDQPDQKQSLDEQEE